MIDADRGCIMSSNPRDVPRLQAAAAWPLATAVRQELVRPLDEAVAGRARMSVVVMTRDRRKGVLATLERLLALPDEPRVIVVDNGSEDGTADAISARFPQVRLLELGRNHGAVARTFGVRAATTPYVAFADDDSWWEPHALRTAADVFERSPRLGLLAARILVGSEGRLDPVCEAMAASPLPVAPDAPGPSVLGFVACGAVVRRRAYLEVGGFNPVVFFFGEETVLAQDLMTAGWQLAYVDGVVARHDPGRAPELRSGRDRLAVRNALLSLWMRRPARVAASQSLRLLAEQHGPTAAGGLLDAVRRAPRALAHRRVLPPSVERQVRMLERQR